MCADECKKWHVCAASSKGRRRENQDNFLLIVPGKDKISSRMLENGYLVHPDLINWPKTHIRLAVADGMGGHENGREISEQAITALLKIPPQSDPAILRDEIMNLHRCLNENFYTGDEKNPGTTLIIADIEKETGKGVLLHIGDSRAFKVCKNQWNLLTYDHNVIEFAFRDDEIDEELYKARCEAGPHRIIQALGYGSMGIVPESDGYKPYRFDKSIRLDLATDLSGFSSGHADVFSFELSQKDVLVLATDGLWNIGSDVRWKPPLISCDKLDDEYAERVVGEAVNLGSRDNVTIAACGFG